MSLFDWFKRDWQHSNPEKRAKALQNLDDSYQDVFADKATTDSDKSVRLEALKKLTSIDVLRRIADSDSEESIRKLATTRLYEEIAKHLKSFRGEPTAREFALAEELSANTSADEVYNVLSHPKLRLVIVKKSHRQPFLVQAALRDINEENALAALENIQSQAALQEVSEKSRHNSVRQKAAAKLKASREKEIVVPKKEDVLALQRKALLSQAEHLAEAKPVLAQVDSFKLLMEEASKIDMGEMSQTLQNLYEGFSAKVAVEKEKEALAEKEKQLKVEQQTARLRITEELNRLLQGAKTEENISAMESLKAEGALLVSGADKAWVDKYQDLVRRLAKVQEEMAKVPEPPKVIADNLGLKELLGELSSLAEASVNAYTEKNLYKIKSSFEALPSEGILSEDKQTYEALVSSLTGKISAWKEASEKEYAEKSTVLRSLIDQVNAIEESEDFREISQKLKTIKFQWKETVGEDKFRYQDLWKEFLDASSRFQEMRQWESWRNEMDKDSLLAELQKLSEENPSEELLDKTKKLIAQWKDIGPVSALRVQEYRDNFKVLVDKIFEACSPILEAKQEEREANLRQKVELCEKAEQLLSREDIPGKEKYLEMKKIQEAWKTVGQIPKESVQPMWERFRTAIDAFYSLHKEYLKAEDSRRQENYEKKVKLCEEIEALKESSDFAATTTVVKRIQEEWKTTGPVPKDLSDEIWGRFREACDYFFNKRREYFESLDAAKQENLRKKIALCEKLEAMSSSSAKASDLEQLVAEWNSVGMVPKEDLGVLLARYMKAYNDVLELLSKDDSALAERLQQVASRKKEIIDSIVNLSENAGFSASAESVKALQVEWKELGYCGANEESLNKDYHTACDEFFARRRDQLDIQEEARKNNLQKKQMLCEQAEKLLTSDDSSYNLVSQVKQLRKLWKEIGPVPREHSDKIWKHFNQTCDKVFALARPQKVESAPNTNEANPAEAEQ